MLKNFLVLLLLGFIVFGCKSENDKLTDLEIGRNYYPLKKGNYWIYDVTETTVRNNIYDSVKYQVRETVDTVYRNLENEDTYHIIRARRQNASAAWLNDSVFTANKSGTNVRLTHNNYKVVKLIFPVMEGKGWDANAFNTLEENQYYFRDIGQAYALRDTTYSNTLTVVQGEPNEVTLDDRYEIYAYGIGLVHKRFIVYEYFQNQGIIDNTRVTKGTRKEMSLISYHIKP